MIDTHCHLLPDVDDGARSQLEAVEMARGLVQFGVRRVVCTPHYSRRFPTSTETAVARLGSLRHALGALEIELTLDLGAEISANMALRSPADELGGRSLPGGYVLVELVATTGARDVERIVERLAKLGLIAVLAHPERCEAVRRDTAIIDDARAAGSLLQVVAPSLLGSTGSTVAEAAWGFVESGRADLLATDAHRPSQPQIQLGPLADVVANRYGPGAADLLTRGNPTRLVDSRIRASGSRP